MSVYVDIKGVNELQKTFSNLSVELQRRIGVRAVSQAAKVIQDEVTARAPVRQVPPGHRAGHRIGPKASGLRFPGNLKSHIIRRRRRGTAGNKITYEVLFAKYAWYGRLVETGTKTAAAHPFMRPAIDAKGEAGIDKFREVFASGIDAAVRAAQ
jgi:HK97 gp10 family phage protein